jgi:hypothetical protein
MSSTKVSSPKDGVVSSSESRKGAGGGSSPSNYIIPLLLVTAHAVFLWSQYEPIVKGFDATGEFSIHWAWPSGLALFYLVAVWFGKYAMGPRVAEGRAFNPKELVLVHNIYLTLLSAFMGVGLLYEGYKSGALLDWKVSHTTYPSRTCAFLLWVNYQSKFWEFGDTLIMILKGNFKQVSALHLSHHSEMGLVMWACLILSPGGQSFFAPMINSFIHVIMYAYYTASGLGYKVSGKLIVTALQITQFFVILAHSAFQLYHGGAYWPQPLCYVTIALMFQMIYMFSDFFVKEVGKDAGDKGGNAAQRKKDDGDAPPSKSSATASKK